MSQPVPIRRVEDPTPLVAILAAKLACHNPEDSAVAWAIRWLEEKR